MVLREVGDCGLRNVWCLVGHGNCVVSECLCCWGDPCCCVEGVGIVVVWEQWDGVWQTRDWGVWLTIIWCILVAVVWLVVVWGGRLGSVVVESVLSRAG